MIEEIEATPQCRTCGGVRPVSEFDIRADTGRRKTQCKACRRSYQNARNSRTNASVSRQARLAGTNELLSCTRCGMFKPAAAFPRKRRDSERLHSWCRECSADVKARRYAGNRERERGRIYRRMEQVRQQTRQVLIEYAAANPCACGARDLDQLRLVFPGADPVTLLSLVSSGRAVSSVGAMLAGASTACRSCLLGGDADLTELGSKGRRRTTPYPPIGSEGGTRRCTSCGQTKPLADFPPKYRDYRAPASRCRGCHAVYHRDWYKRNKERILKRINVNRRRSGPVVHKIVYLDARLRRWEYLLSHPCVDCGETDPVVLEFDHRGEKRSAIVDLMRRHAPWEEILAEIGKCDVRCANCHRRRTARVRGYYRELNSVDSLDHEGLTEVNGAWTPRPRTGTIRRPADSKSAALSN